MTRVARSPESNPWVRAPPHRLTSGVELTVQEITGCARFSC